MTSAAFSLLGNIRLWVEEEEAGTRTNDLCRSRWPGTLKGTLRSCEDTFEDLLWFALCFMCIGALGASSCEGGEAERGRERERRQAGGERTKPTWETIFQNKRSCWWEGRCVCSGTGQFVMRDWDWPQSTAAGTPLVWLWCWKWNSLLKRVEVVTHSACFATNHRRAINPPETHCELSPDIYLLSLHMWFRRKSCRVNFSNFPPTFTSFSSLQIEHINRPLKASSPHELAFLCSDLFLLTVLQTESCFLGSVCIRGSLVV